ncbi:Amidase signature domain [Dillenia turbinata]|uniref:Amidase signature domain n=1 Tax=Dillenia turbinata TaxID=194707 RepID=A0AAN8V9M5_9MAGN
MLAQFCSCDGYCVFLIVHMVNYCCDVYVEFLSMARKYNIFSISGENKHYGTPTNPAVPARVPGGSSSGAAVAVAANLVDFSLGNIQASSVISPVEFAVIDICICRTCICV